LSYPTTTKLYTFKGAVTTCTKIGDLKVELLLKYKTVQKGLARESGALGGLFDEKNRS
jgi:hypothetical protein